MYRFAALSGLTLLGVSCADRSRSTDILFEATATVDGRKVHASTVWRVRTSDVFPQGAVARVRGTALAIPISDEQWVYGLFRVLDGNVLGSWPLMLQPLGGVARKIDNKQASRPPVPNSSSAQFDYLIRVLAGRRTEICVPIPLHNRPPAKPCPIFVYFDNPKDFRHPQMAFPQQEVRINGHSFRIDHLFVTLGNFPSPTKKSTMPPFVKPGINQVFGKLASNTETIFSTNLSTSDFWRSE